MKTKLLNDHITSSKFQTYVSFGNQNQTGKYGFGVFEPKLNFVIKTNHTLSYSWLTPNNNHNHLFNKYKYINTILMLYIIFY